jgi:tetratricopeptide (TPR) repeat protein
MFQLLEQIRMNYFQRKGQKLLMKGKPEKAFPYLEKALMLEDSAANLFNLALTLLTLQHYAEAEKYLQKILDNYPGNELTTLTLAELYMQQREWNKAKSLFQNMVRIHPNNKNYKTYLRRIDNPEQRESYIQAKELLNRSQNLLEQKKNKEALQALLQAERHDPENPYIQNNIGTFYLILEKKPKIALTYYQKAYQLEPENEKFKENLFRTRKLIKE